MDLNTDCKRTRFPLLTLAVFTLCGCGTIGTRLYDDPAKSGDYHGSKVYSGVKGDIEALDRMINSKVASDREAPFLFFLLDIPFSFVVDTLLLPITIYEDLSKGGQKTKVHPSNPPDLNTGQSTGK
jgi:uncharacterized protein YceK